MAQYVDGFVLVVPKAKSEDYKKMAEMGKEMWMRLGAVAYMEAKSDDLSVMDMGEEKSRSFMEMTGATEQDDVWFSYIVFNSKEHRDEVNAKVMKEMSEDKDMAAMAAPFEMKKMAYGGFAAQVTG